MKKILYIFLIAVVVASCARMGSPDGGWYDDDPPRVLYSTPAEQATNVKEKKMTIYFDEFIKLADPTQNVIVSPPQLEMPEIKATGRKIVIELQDTLIPNTTYTVDFSDAISDNNEGNPMGNYTYTFSTGEQIDTFEVAGNVLDASNLEPVKGISVGLYADLADSAFRTKPLLRIARTDGRGRFCIRGVAPGEYRVYALQDMDANYMFSQKSEMIAFSHQTYKPTAGPDIRQDTIWRDSLRIERIERVGYTHFLPDDIILRAFTEEQTDRYLLKTERQQPELLRIYFSNAADTLPTLRGLDFDTDGAFVIETSAKNDTINYWLRDTLLVNRDTLTTELTYMATDTAGLLQQQTDTITFIPKQSYERRKKEQQKQIDEWLKAQEKKKKKGQPYDSIMPTPHLEMKLEAPAQLDPDRNITITFPTPLATIDTSAIHLYAKHDTLWYVSRFQVDTLDTYLETRYQIRGEWRPEVEYSLEFDSLAFTDIYGHTTDKRKAGFKVRGLDEYAVIMLTLTGFEGKPVIAQLIDNSDKVVKQTFTETGVADFYYVEPHTYYLRMFVDENRNGRWDTGDYDLRRQAEAVYYYPKEIECRAKWDLPLTWNPTATPVEQQKPSALIKQKSEKRRNVKSRNLERARQKGIPVSEIPEKY